MFADRYVHWKRGWLPPRNSTWWNEYQWERGASYMYSNSRPELVRVPFQLDFACYVRPLRIIDFDMYDLPEFA